MATSPIWALGNLQDVFSVFQQLPWQLRQSSASRFSFHLRSSSGTLGSISIVTGESVLRATRRFLAGREQTNAFQGLITTAFLLSSLLLLASLASPSSKSSGTFIPTHNQKHYCDLCLYPQSPHSDVCIAIKTADSQYSAGGETITNKELDEHSVATGTFAIVKRNDAFVTRVSVSISVCFQTITDVAVISGNSNRDIYH